MSGIRFRPSKTKTKTRTKADKTKADRTKADKTKAKVRTTEKHDLLRDKTAVSKLKELMNGHTWTLTSAFTRLSEPQYLPDTFMILDVASRTTKTCNGAWKCSTKNQSNSIQNWCSGIVATIF